MSSFLLVPCELHQISNKKPSVGGNAGFDRKETTVRGVTVVRVAYQYSPFLHFVKCLVAFGSSGNAEVRFLDGQMCLTGVIFPSTILRILSARFARSGLCVATTKV